MVHKIRGPERGLLLFAGFSVIAAGWLLLGYWLSRRVAPSFVPSFAPSFAPSASLGEAPRAVFAAPLLTAPRAERIGRMSNTNYQVDTSPVAIVDTAMPGTRRTVVISSDVPIRIAQNGASATTGVYFGSGTPYTWPHELLPGDSLRAVAVSTLANVSVQITTVRG